MRRSAILFAGTLMGASLAWLVGFATALHVSPPGPTAGLRAAPAFALFGEVWAWVDAEFYGRKPLPRQVTAAAIEGLVESLDDPHAAYLSRDDAASARAASKPAEAEGIGAWVEPAAAGALVLSTLPGTPARRAGLKPGDRIVELDGRPVAGLDRAGLEGALRGPEGSSLRMLVVSPGGQARSLELVRSRYPRPALRLRRPASGVAYLELARFDGDVLDPLDASLEGLAAEPAEALVLDLRDNPGGSLESARRVAGRFFDDVLWLQLERGGRPRPWRSITEDAAPVHLPEQLAVLINGGTASAAEMLAGALREHRGARIYGQPSFGKDRIQGLVALSDASMLRFTVARWTTPKGLSVGDGGLRPDVQIDGDEARGAFDLASDPVLAAALAALEGEPARTGGEER